MKKLILITFTFLLITFSGDAQISQGTILLGGGISAYSHKSETMSTENKTTGFFINPSIGFTLRPNNVVGIIGTYGSQNNKNNNAASEHKDNTYGGGFYFRRYLSLSKSFFLFGEGNTLYTHRNFSQTSVLAENILKQNTFEINLYPGIAFAVNKRFHLEAGINNIVSLSFQQSINENRSAGTTFRTESRGLNFSSNASSTFPLTIGFRFVLGK